MFQGASSFNQPLSLDTSSVTDMSWMFFGASAFNQPLSLDTSSVTDMSYMFYSASAFNQPLSFDTSSVTDMSYMFYVRSAHALAPQPSQPGPHPVHAARALPPAHALPPLARTPRPASHALLSIFGSWHRRSTSR